MKKIFAMILVLAMMLSLAACGGSPAPATTPASNSTPTPTATNAPDDSSVSYRVAIVQQMDHSSLDEIRLAIEIGRASCRERV